MKRIFRLTLPWLSLLVIGAIAVALRYGLVESADVAHACDAATTFQCDARHTIVMGFVLAPIGTYQMGIYGWLALAAAVLAFFWKRPATAWFAAATGVVALILYCFAPGALALLVGCLRLVRLQSGGTSPFHQHRAGEPQIHAQP